MARLRTLAPSAAASAAPSAAASSAASAAPDASAPAAQAAKPARPGRRARANERPVPPNPPSAPSKELHTFANPSPGRDYWIQFQVPEFTCHCPLTGQPDFAHFTIDMIADQLCVELKSLKMYFWSYRDQGAFHEKVTNAILDDIVAATKPRFIRITAKWYVRGGIYTNVVAEHRKKGWKPAPAVDVPAQATERGLLG